ncbi:MFS transporter [Arcticibacterium luteifluviistationis]|uniref:MFS transporter n=1 Tax=Arcticibacterium luteifluviistationis TaxID=1784714 RepID=A0A2Z4GD30_9BACT|nr:MFS transporter [Arcticibacterium luteifluviistationis]AWV99222.1 MFS transporter [Arcticibacterium luteifluviistationis]
MDFIKNQKKVIRAWCMYDWANSVHNLVITSVIFPIYFHATAVNADGGDVINFLGFELNNDVLYSYTLSLATLSLVILSPILTGIADYSGRRKFFMKFFCYLGAASCMYFFFFTKDNITAAVIAFGLSLVGWGGSVVFYNSFLPDIVTEDRFDKTSATGFAYGYVGSVLLLITNLAMIMKPELFGLTQADSDSGYTSRIAFITVGIWWAVFAQIPFYYLPKDQSKPFQIQWIKKGFLELKKVYKEMQTKKLIKRFLAALFVYDMGVMTVIYVAALFADKELNIPTQGLIITILLIQLVAIPGSYLASFLSRKYGNTIALRIIVAVWATVPLAAYLCTTAEQFYVIASVVGLVMGGVQSLSRSTYAKLIPEGTKDVASYFSLYDVVERSATAIGTFFFGFIIQQTGDMRNSVLLILVLFVIGFLLLMRIPSKHIYD